MTPYIIVFIILLVLVALDFTEDRLLKLGAFVISYCALLVLIGLRDQTGTDWIFYSDHFTQLVLPSDVDTYSFDIGYQLIAKATSLLGFNYNGFLFLYTAIYLFVFFAAFWRIPNANLAVLIFYSVYLIAFMGTSRQMMALAISAYAFVNLRDRKIGVFLISVLIAATFHKSALMLILGLLFPREGKVISWKIVVSLSVPVLVSVLSASALFEILLYFLSFSDLFVSKLMDYSVSDDQLPIFYTDDPSLVALLYLKRCIMFALLWYLSNSNPHQKTIRLCFQFYAAGFLIFMALYSFLPAVAVRLSLVFTFFEVFALASIKDAKRGVLITALFLMAFVPERLMSNLKGPDSDLLVPYKGYLFNTNVVRSLR